MKVYYVAVNVYRHSDLPLGVAYTQAYPRHITLALGSSAIHVYEYSYLGSTSIQARLSRKTCGIMPNYTKIQTFLNFRKYKYLSTIQLSAFKTFM
jgi:hypothetical protein